MWRVRGREGRDGDGRLLLWRRRLRRGCGRRIDGDHLRRHRHGCRCDSDGNRCRRDDNWSDGNRYGRGCRCRCGSRRDDGHRSAICLSRQSFDTCAHVCGLLRHGVDIAVAEVECAVVLVATSAARPHCQLLRAHIAQGWTSRLLRHGLRIRLWLRLRLWFRFRFGWWRDYLRLGWCRFRRRFGSCGWCWFGCGCGRGWWCGLRSDDERLALVRLLRRRLVHVLVALTTEDLATVVALDRCRVLAAQVAFGGVTTGGGSGSWRRWCRCATFRVTLVRLILRRLVQLGVAGGAQLLIAGRTHDGSSLLVAQLALSHVGGGCSGGGGGRWWRLRGGRRRRLGASERRALVRGQLGRLVKVLGKEGTHHRQRPGQPAVHSLHARLAGAVTGSSASVFVSHPCRTVRIVLGRTPHIAAWPARPRRARTRPSRADERAASVTARVSDRRRVSGMGSEADEKVRVWRGGRVWA